jgi:hypothetical protein
MNGQAQAAKIDVATSSGARETVEFCKEAFGSVDLVVRVQWAIWLASSIYS